MARVTHVRKVYVYEDGAEGRSAKPGWKKLRFEMLAPNKDDDGNFVVVDTREITPDMFDGEIVHCAAGHGLSQKIGDDLAGIDKKAANDGASFDPETGYAAYIGQRIDDMVDNLKNGVWVAEGEGSTGGGNVTILFEAIMRAFEEAGVDVSEEQKAGIREKLKDEQFRKNARARADVAMHVAEITAERAAARAKAAAEKAAEASDEDTVADLLG